MLMDHSRLLLIIFVIYHQNLVLLNENLVLFLLLWMELKEAPSLLLLNTILLMSSFRNTPTPQPRTEGFWNDIFPYLTDGDDDNFLARDLFRRHFRVSRATFRYIVSRLDGHRLYQPSPFLPKCL